MASGNIDLSLVPWGHSVSHMTAGYLQCLLSLALSNHSTLHWSLAGPRLDSSHTDRCKGVFSLSFSPGVLQPPNNMEQHEGIRGRACMWLRVCDGVCTQEQEREWDIWRETQTVCRTNEFQANLSYEWASGGHTSPDSAMNRITNKTVLLDLHLAEGKESFKVAIRESFMSRCLTWKIEQASCCYKLRRVKAVGEYFVSRNFWNWLLL